MGAPSDTLVSLLAPRLAELPDAPAIIEGARAFSWREFAAMSEAAAGWLWQQGVRPGDRVALWLVNRTEWLALQFGLARIGAAAMAVNTRFRSSEIAYILEKSEAKLLVLQLNFRRIDFPAVLSGVDASSLPHLARVGVVGAEGSDIPPTVLGRPTVRLDLADLVTPKVPAAPDHATGDAPVVLFTTSGTTKGPKLVVHTQRTITYHARHVARAFRFDEPGAKLSTLSPFCGVFGYVSTIGALTAGAPVYMLEAFDAQLAVEQFRRHAITHGFVGDDMGRRMLEVAPTENPLPAVRFIGYAIFNPGAVEWAIGCRKRGIPVTGLYGSSEVQALFSVQPATLPPEEVVLGGGRPTAAPEADVRVRDPETGELLPPGKAGEVEIRSPGNFIGYLNNAAATREAVRADGYFRTGDFGSMRDDGSFVYEGRIGDAMRLSGFLVSPADIEDEIKSLAGVASAQVVAAEIGGQNRPVAFVIPDGSRPLAPEAIIAHVEARMAKFKAPARVWLVEEFPTTASANGIKIQKAKLRQMASERLADGG